MTVQTVQFGGKPYVILPREDYDRLTTLAKAAELPELPSGTSGGMPLNMRVPAWREKSSAIGSPWG